MAIPDKTRRLLARQGDEHYLASRDVYQSSILSNGRPTGTREQVLDCACGLYLNDPTSWP